MTKRLNVESRRVDNECVRRRARSGPIQSGPVRSGLLDVTTRAAANDSVHVQANRKEENEAASKKKKKKGFSKDENTVWAKFLASPAAAAAAASANLTSGDLIDLKGAAKNLWRQGVWSAATAQQLGASRAPAQRDA